MGLKENLKGRRQSKNVIDTTTPEGMKKHKKDMAKFHQTEKAKKSSHLLNKTPMKEQKATSFENFHSRATNRDPYLIHKKHKKMIQVTPGKWKIEHKKDMK